MDLTTTQEVTATECGKLQKTIQPALNTKSHHSRAGLNYNQPWTWEVNAVALDLATTNH